MTGAAKDIDKHLEDLTTKYGFIRPKRDVDSYPAAAAWKSGKPDYGKADLVFFEGRCKNHAEGSLPFTVENLVKKWEMEMTHLDKKDWTVVDSDVYRVSTNGKECNGLEAAMKGTYNWLLTNTPKELYDPSTQTFESSHQLFRGAFPDGFAWEVLEVFSGPPKVAFTWRHWGRFTGSYEGNSGNGEMLELYGFTIAIVKESLKIESLEVYFKPEGFLEALKGVVDAEELKNGKAFIGSGCPIHSLQNS